MKRIDPHDNVFRAAARELGLSRDDFTKRMQALLNKLELYARIGRGDAKLRKVWIASYTVPEHKVTGHWRHIEDRRRAPATRRIRRKPRLKLIQGGKR